MSYFNTKPFVVIAAALAGATAAIAQTNPPAWSSTASYKIGDIVSYEGIDFQCLINETSTHPNPHVPADWDIYFVYSGNVTVPAGPTAACLTLTSAWNYIKYARLAVGATITISLQNNYYETFSSSFSLDHPFGAQISIIGNNTNQIASFTTTGTGFVLDSGHTLGALEGLSITAPNGGSDGTPAVKVKQKAVLVNASNLYILNFDIGLETDSGEIDNVSEISLQQFKTGGVLSSGHGAVINFTGAVTVDGANTTGNAPTYGFEATQGGSIYCYSGCAANNCDNCFYATANGAIYCDNSTASTPTNKSFYACYFAEDHGMIHAAGAAASGGIIGFSCTRNSYISAASSSATGYSSDGYDARNLSGIDATGSTSGTSGHDSLSYVL